MNLDTKTKWDVSISITLLIAALMMPLFIDSRYILSQCILFLIWATVVSQWNIVMGVAGIFSLAQLALFAVGGYTAAMLATYFGISLWAGMFLGGITAVLFSLLIGFACLRLRGVYVALLTFAIAQALFLLISTDISCFIGEGQTCQTLTGGPRGMTGFGDFGFRELLGRNYQIGNYYVALLALGLATITSILVIRGPLGFAFRALRDNESVAISSGISRFKYQLFVFAVSGFVTGLAGGVYAGHFKVIGPSVLGMPQLTFLVSMMVVGGLGRLWGPILGAALIMFADEQLKDFAEYRNIGLGAIIVGFVVMLPEGIVGAVEKAYASFTKRKEEHFHIKAD